MQVTLLRKMTLKSVIGFGRYKEMTVGQLLDVGYYSELIRMYYNLQRIDFVQDIKDLLFITKDREIQKPGKDFEIGAKYTLACINDILEKKKEGKSTENRFGIDQHHTIRSKAKRKQGSISRLVVLNKSNSKNENRIRNHGK